MCEEGAQPVVQAAEGNMIAVSKLIEQPQHAMHFYPRGHG
jgi:hypothetical protein